VVKSKGSGGKGRRQFGFVRQCRQGRLAGKIKPEKNHYRDGRGGGKRGASLKKCLILKWGGKREQNGQAAGAREGKKEGNFFGDQRRLLLGLWIQGRSAGLASCKHRQPQSTYGEKKRKERCELYIGRYLQTKEEKVGRKKGEES